GPSAPACARSARSPSTRPAPPTASPTAPCSAADPARRPPTPLHTRPPPAGPSRTQARGSANSYGPADLVRCTVRAGSGATSSSGDVRHQPSEARPPSPAAAATSPGLPPRPGPTAPPRQRAGRHPPPTGPSPRCLGGVRTRTVLPISYGAPYELGPALRVRGMGVGRVAVRGR